jgi:hypothetical protein
MVVEENITFLFVIFGVPPDIRTHQLMFSNHRPVSLNQLARFVDPQKAVAFYGGGA